MIGWIVLIGLAVFFAFCPHFLVIAWYFPFALYRHLRYRRGRLFGVRAYIGGVGTGKTMSMVREYVNLRKKYPNAEFWSNASVAGCRQIDNFDQFISAITKCEKPVLVLWDEVGVDLNCRGWSSTPMELIFALAQNRKGNGVRLLYTAQSYDMVDKQLRSLTNDVISCDTLLEEITLNYHTKINSDGKTSPRLPCTVYNNLKFRKEYDTYETVSKMARHYSTDGVNVERQCVG